MHHQWWTSLKNNGHYGGPAGNNAAIALAGKTTSNNSGTVSGVGTGNNANSGAANSNLNPNPNLGLTGNTTAIWHSNENFPFPKNCPLPDDGFLADGPWLEKIRRENRAAVYNYTYKHLMDCKARAGGLAGSKHPFKDAHSAVLAACGLRELKLLGADKDVSHLPKQWWIPYSNGSTYKHSGPPLTGGQMQTAMAHLNISKRHEIDDGGKELFNGSEKKDMKKQRK